MSVIPDFGEAFAEARQRRREQRHRRADALTLVRRIRAGADELRQEGADPARVLTDRGYGPDIAKGKINPAEWGARQLDAAAAAEAYADRFEATLAGQPGMVPDQVYREAEKVAKAAQLGGILIDGSRLANSAVENPSNDAGMRSAILGHQAAEESAIGGSGAFAHVAETINGIEQVPFWRLSTAAGPGADPPVREDGNAGFYDPAHLTGDHEEDARVRQGLCPYWVGSDGWGDPRAVCEAARSPDDGDHPFCRAHAARIRDDRGRGGYVAPSGDVDEQLPIVAPAGPAEVWDWEGYTGGAVVERGTVPTDGVALLVASNRVRFDTIRLTLARTGSVVDHHRDGRVNVVRYPANR